MKTMPISELRQLVREAYKALGPDFVVFLRLSQRPDLGYMVTLAHVDEGQTMASSMRLRKFQDVHGEVFMPTAEERQAMPKQTRSQRTASMWTFQLIAVTKKEADFQLKLVVADLQGKGFVVETLPDSGDPEQASPYR